MTKELEGKTALVTGGGSGIGEGIARALAAAGANVAISGRRREVLEEVGESSVDEGGLALAVTGDVADPAAAQRMVDATVDAFGALHILVNNAGIARGGPLPGMSDEDIDAVIDIDLKGPIHVLRAALPHLEQHQDSGGASVINISSSVTQTVLGNFSVYSAAKAGLNQLTRCLALRRGHPHLRDRDAGNRRQEIHRRRRRHHPPGPPRPPRRYRPAGPLPGLGAERVDDRLDPHPGRGGEPGGERLSPESSAPTSNFSPCSRI